MLALVREHAGELLRFARRFSICADDAQDAYQRTLEKLVLRMRGTPPTNVLSWVRTVLRHESLAVRAERERMLGRALLDDERNGDAAAVDPAERVERFERLAHTAEALRGLKPQELTALALRAEGLSYREICERTSWSYTRCNRAITEGRRALLTRLRAIESGAECDRWLPILSRFADGEADVGEVAKLRPHLRACAGCRATLRGFHAAPAQIGALVPVELLPVMVAAGGGAGGGLGIGRHLEGLLQTFSDRAGMSVLRVQGAIDALPGTKIAAVAASTVAVAGSGAAIEQAATAGVDRARAPRAAVVGAGAAPTPLTAPASIAAPGVAPPAAPVAPDPNAAAGVGPSASTGPVFAAVEGAPGEFALEQSSSPPSAGGSQPPAEHETAGATPAGVLASGNAASTRTQAFAREGAAAEPAPGGRDTDAGRAPGERDADGGQAPAERGVDDAHGKATSNPAAPSNPTAAPAPTAPPAFDRQPSEPTQAAPPAAATGGGEFGF